MESNLKLFSLAEVIASNPEGGFVIEVVPIEHLSAMDSGLIKDQEKTYSDTSGANFATQAKAKQTITATWLSLDGGNRITAPCVYANEKVLLFKYAEVDEYRWVNIGVESGIRGRERVVFAVSNVDHMAGFTDKSSYWVEMDTINKRMRVHTSDNDGELTTYDLTIDTKLGLFTFKDGRGNSIQLSSGEDKLTAQIKKLIEVSAGVAIQGTAPLVSLRANSIAVSALGGKDGGVAMDMQSVGAIKLSSTKEIVLQGKFIQIDGELRVRGGIHAEGGIDSDTDVTIRKTSVKS